MNYIVMDLEWNQGEPGREVEGLPFEIIEIGAVKMNDRFELTGKFSQLIRPKVYRKMHNITGSLLHLRMRDLDAGKPFTEAMNDFLDWVGPEEHIFCTWSTQDLTELQRNMRYFRMAPLGNGPLEYLDIQKLFAIHNNERKTRRSLESVVDMLDLRKDARFHRALEDAFYTAKVFAKIGTGNEKLTENTSYDLFHVPARREEEIRRQYDTYFKYISREFPTKSDAFADNDVSATRCYICRRNLRKKIKWFSLNGKQYYSLAYCDKHGYLKGKIRIKKSEEGLPFIVKTTKFIDETEADSIREQSEYAKTVSKKKKASQKNNK